MRDATQRKRETIRALLDACNANGSGVTVTFWPMDDSVSTSTCAAYGDAAFPNLGVEPLVLRDGAAAATVKSTLFSLNTPSGCRVYKMTGATYGFVASDSNDFSFGDGTVDSPFSLLCWLSADTLAVSANGRMVFSKRYYTAGTGEYTFHIRGARSNLYIALKDESAGAFEDLDFSTNISSTQFFHPVMFTYDGTETSPTVSLYRGDFSRSTLGISTAHVLCSTADAGNASNNTVESGAYTAMENTAVPFGFGCSPDSAAGAVQTANVWLGNLALPTVVKGTALSEASFMRYIAASRRLLRGE